MRQLYPAIRPYTSQRLEVGEGHRLYVEECGSPEGIPVLFVHGGPGAGCSEQDRRFFDPERYRIILFDQRGAGRSRPHAELADNTTGQLIADIERLRAQLGVERWLLFGGSWGSTLSLLYAQAHPERVLGMVLRGIFLCRKADIDWFYRYGASCIFPDYWQDFVAQIPASEHGDLLDAYHRRLTGGNEIIRMAAAKAWSLWEARCATHDPSPQVVARFGSPPVALAMARIEAHYFVHGAFIAENQICDQAHRLADIPCVIVHGRYDVVCPIEQAMTLRGRLPKAELEVIRDAGHASSEPGTLDALIRATDRFARELAGAR